MAGRFALDIETVSPTLGQYETPPEFDDPRYFELLAVALGHESPEGEVESEVLFREGETPASELALVARTLDWFDQREGTELVTYGGETFDVPQLVGRAKEAESATGSERNGLAERLRALLESELAHVDLRRPAWDAFGDYTRLEDACRNVGVKPSDTRWNEYDHGIDLDELSTREVPGLREGHQQGRPGVRRAVSRARGGRRDGDADLPVATRTVDPLQSGGRVTPVRPRRRASVLIRPLRFGRFLRQLY